MKIGRPRRECPAGLDLTRSVADIAAETGAAPQTVLRWRAEAGAKKPLRSVLAAYVDRLGTTTDRAIAEEAGVTTARVSAFRRGLGIASYCRRG